MRLWPCYLFVILCVLYVHPMDVRAANELQLQIDKAQPGQTIFLENRTYAGPVFISKPLTIIGKQHTVIEGDSQGDVLVIQADDVTIESLTIQASGKGKQQAGIMIDKVDRATIVSNSLQQVQNGIFVRGGKGHRIQGNHIVSYNAHFSKRGNGIHLLATNDTTIDKNQITTVQDGVYLDDATATQIQENTIQDSRYAVHFMFSQNGQVKRNHFSNNINGIMAMNSEQVDLVENRFEQHLNYRGYGVLIYEMKDVNVKDNELFYNQNGLEIQSSEYIQVEGNTFGGNTVGFATSGANKEVIFHQNEMAGNIVQTRLSGNLIELDGNYWDDYHSYDLDGDGIGEIPYETYSASSEWMQRHPHLQFFFESPAMTIWQSMEKMFSISDQSKNRDHEPIVK